MFLVEQMSKVAFHFILKLSFWLNKGTKWEDNSVKHWPMCKQVFGKLRIRRPMMYKFSSSCSTIKIQKFDVLPLNIEFDQQSSLYPKV